MSEPKFEPGNGIRLETINSELQRQGKRLDKIAETLQQIAVQENRLGMTEAQLNTLWRKYNQLADPNTGQLTKIMKWQASCPRGQIKFLWWFVAVVDTAILIALMGVLLK